MKQPVSLALFGCGGISQAHVNGYRDLWLNGCREFQVTACCDVNPDAANIRADQIAEFQGARPQTYASAAALIQSGSAQAADICLPHCFHHGVAIELLDGGLDVLVEKPLGITCRASRAIIAAGERNGRMVATAEQVRRFPTARAFNWAINTRGIIGDVRLVQIESLGYAPFDYANPAAKWRGIKTLTGGGMIMDSGAHFADMVQVLFGAVDQVYCTMQTNDTRIIENAPLVGNQPADVEDAWHAVIRFQSGLHLIWTYSRSYYGEPIRTARYYGTKGSISDNSFPFHPFQVGGDVTLADGSIVPNEQVVADFEATLTPDELDQLYPYGCRDGFAVEVWDFVNAIATGRQPEMDGWEGLKAKTLCEALYESATLHKPVAYDDVFAGRLESYQKPIDAYWKL